MLICSNLDSEILRSHFRVDRNCVRVRHATREAL